MKPYPSRAVAAALFLVSGTTIAPGDSMPLGSAVPAPAESTVPGRASVPVAPPGPCQQATRGFQLPVAAEVVDHFRPPATRWGAGNRGWEFGTSGGERVCAVGSGVVTFAGQVAGRAVVSIAHGDGLVSSLTGLGTVEVAAGDPVAGGTYIATALAGLHLGFRLHGEYVDPATILSGNTHAILVPIPPGAGRAP